MLKRLIIMFLLLQLITACSFSYADEGFEHTEDDVESVQNSSNFESSDAAARLFDNDFNSRLRIAPKETSTFEIPEEATAVRICWYEEPKTATVTQFNRQNAVLSETEVNNEIESLITLGHETVSIGISSSDEIAVSEIVFLSEDEAAAYYSFQTSRRVDIMIIGARAGEEVVSFGGLIPSLSDSGVTAMTVFMSVKNRQQRQEAMDTAAAFHQTLAPVFLDYSYLSVASELFDSKTKKVWKESDAVSDIVSLIRQYQPTVIITHAPYGEDGEGLSKYTAYIVSQAVLLAKNPRRENASYKKFGAHEVQKVYYHGEPLPAKRGKYDKSTPTPVPLPNVIEDYTFSLESFQGKTAYELSKEAIQRYQSLAVFKYIPEQEGRYWLGYTAVGADVGENSFFEHLSESLQPDHVTDDENNMPVLPASSFATPVPVIEIIQTNPPLTEEINESDGSSGDETESSDEDSYFLPAESTEEFVEADEQNGRWEYKSDILSIIIDKNSDDTVPLVWYIAHIRMRDVDSFRPGFGSANEAGSAKIEPWKLARRAKAVFAMTGDNLINTENWLKGVLIRNGKLYSDRTHEPVLALCPDMTLRIYDTDVSAQELLDIGIQNTFGFGPVLVRDGHVSTEECNSHRVKSNNPRAGIGMVEKGHYVCIVVDGRQAGYSVGVTLTDYAEMFVKEGCSVAYNMDGGISAGMLFMGESIHQHRSSYSKKSSGQRPWADAVMFGYSELVPSEKDPIYNTGNLNEKKEKAAEPETQEKTAGKNNSDSLD